LAGSIRFSEVVRSYAVPISFGYDGGDRLYFFMIRFGDSSRKAEFVDNTEEAGFVVYEVESSTRWRSVVAAGEINQVPENDRETMEEMMYDNALAPRLFPYQEPVTSIDRTELRITDLTGRKGMGYD
jgi:nitroimidazol reductase NimA-like FMN-containing flavoprotein (pyridoxamine 5'-phosphate oxidase superfamily)